MATASRTSDALRAIVAPFAEIIPGIRRAGWSSSALRPVTASALINTAA